MKREEKKDQTEHETCESISEDEYFWTELHTLVEDGVKASNEE